MLQKSQNHNPNYLAKVVRLQKPVQHPNADRLLGWIIDGNRVWTDNINYKEGDIVVYFPLECQINPLILSQLNLYSNSDMNVDKTQKGFFDKNGRVKAIRLRGEPSEGFILKITTLEECLNKLQILHHTDSSMYIIDKEFDTINDTWVCKKYIPINQGRTTVQKQSQKVRDVLLPEQFRFHYDTEQLKKHIDKIKPDDLITITKKYHGTSGVSANVLVKKQWSKIVKFFNTSFTVENCICTFWLMLSLISYKLLPVYLNVYWLIFPHIFIMFFNKKYRDFMRQSIGYLPKTEYKDICSSRKVIKSVGEETKSSGGFYSFDIWKHCHEILKPSLEQGITLYYEIVGYLPNGQMIQKGYDYACKDGSREVSSLKTDKHNFRINTNDEFYSEYKEGKNFKILIYRITYTTAEGKVIEFSWQQIKRYCERYGLNTPRVYSEGTVSSLLYENGFPTDSTENLINVLTKSDFTKIINFEGDDEECQNKVPDEGIVLRIENGKPEAYKLKSFAFLEKESKTLDEGTSDIETEQINE